MKRESALFQLSGSYEDYSWNNYDNPATLNVGTNRK
jgi:hypothetical protein